MPNKAEKNYMAAVADIGCIVCLNLGYGQSPAEIHHISTGAKSKRASNFDIIGLCPNHHRLGGHGIAIHAGRKTWEARYGTENELMSQVRDIVGIAGLATSTR